MTPPATESKPPPTITVKSVREILSRRSGTLRPLADFPSEVGKVTDQAQELESKNTIGLSRRFLSKISITPDAALDTRTVLKGSIESTLKGTPSARRQKDVPWSKGTYRGFLEKMRPTDLFETHLPQTLPTNILRHK